MKLIRLSLEGFGKFRNESFDFSEGINVFYGLNEAGKSTIHAAIEGVLYGFFDPTKKRRTMLGSDHARYDVGKSANYKASLVFEMDNATYRIDREFNKRKPSVTVFNEKTGEDITGSLTLDASTNLPDIAKWIDMPYFLYKNTLSMKQLESATEKSASDDLIRRLQNLKQTRSETFSSHQALKKLDDSIKEIGTERAHSKPYALAKARLEELNQEYDDTRRVHAQMLEEKNTLEKLTREAMNIEADLKKMRHQAFLEENTKKRLRYDKVQAKLKEINVSLSESSSNLPEALLQAFESVKDTLNSLPNTLKELESMTVKINTLNDTLPKEDEVNDENTLTRINKAYENFKTLKTQKDEIKAEHLAKEQDALNTELETLNAEKVQTVKNTKRYKKLMFTLILLPYALFKWLLEKKEYTRLSARALVIEEKLTATTKEHSRQVKQNLVAKEGLTRVLSSTHCKDEKELETLVYRTRDYYQNFLRREKMRALVHTYKQDYNQKLQTLSVIEDVFKLDLTIKNLKTLDQAYDTYKEITRMLDYQKLTDLKSTIDFSLETVTLDKVEETKSEALALKESLDNINKKIHEQSVLINENLRRVRDLETIDYEKEKVKESILKLEHKLTVYEDAQKRIEKAISRMEEDFAPILSSNIEHYIKPLTKENYSTIKVRKDLTFTVENPVTKELKTPLYFSTGTLDQLYLSMRLGILRTLNKESVPLFLDDTFVNYDDVRLKAALSVLSSLKGGHQILLFTCQRRESELLKALSVTFKQHTLT